MAINVGYSVGWGYPSETTVGSRIFSMVYVLTGIFMIALSLGYFAQSIISSSKSWYVTALRQEKFRTASFRQRIMLWMKMHKGSLMLISLWLIWIAAMVIFSLNTTKWRFTEAVYFAVSSLSTGGLWSIPADSPDWHFAVGTTAKYTLLTLLYLTCKCCLSLLYLLYSHVMINLSTFYIKSFCPTKVLSRCAFSSFLYLL